VAGQERFLGLLVEPFRARNQGNWWHRCNLLAGLPSVRQRRTGWLLATGSTEMAGAALRDRQRPATHQKVTPARSGGSAGQPPTSNDANRLTSEPHARLGASSTMAEEVAEVHDRLDAVDERAGLRIDALQVLQACSESLPCLAGPFAKAACAAAEELRRVQCEEQGSKVMVPTEAEPCRGDQLPEHSAGEGRLAYVRRQTHGIRQRLPYGLIFGWFERSITAREEVSEVQQLPCFVRVVLVASLTFCINGSRLGLGCCERRRRIGVGG
jgi:hypothetical protein